MGWEFGLLQGRTYKITLTSTAVVTILFMNADPTHRVFFFDFLKFVV
jgi:hypothetical protein